MGKHAKPWRPFKYPARVYKHYFLNQWLFFIKPKMRKQFSETKRDILRFIRYNK